VPGQRQGRQPRPDTAQRWGYITRNSGVRKLAGSREPGTALGCKPVARWPDPMAGRQQG